MLIYPRDVKIQTNMIINVENYIKGIQQQWTFRDD